jgi:hypothetical protein
LEFVEFVNRSGEMWHCIAGLEGVNINTLFFVHYLALNDGLPLPIAFACLGPGRFESA